MTKAKSNGNKMTVRSFYAAAGFEVQNTGGNCTALVKRVGHVNSIYVTSWQGACIPTSLTEAVTVGLYCDDHGDALAQEAMVDSKYALEAVLRLEMNVYGFSWEYPGFFSADVNGHNFTVGLDGEPDEKFVCQATSKDGDSLGEELDYGKCNTVEDVLKAMQVFAEAFPVAADAPTWLKEFPRMCVVLDPTKYGLEDTSWHNDVCPSFSVEKPDPQNPEHTYTAERLWVDYFHKAQREMTDHPRFTYELCAPDHSEPLEILLSTEDLDVAKAFLQKRLVQRVGQRFVEVLKEDLTEAEFAEVVWRNRADPDAHGETICHSHDFCDANMSMDRALRECGIDPLPDLDEGMTQETTDVWNEAWKHAKANGLIAPEGAKSPMDTLQAEYDAFLKTHGFPAWSADELLGSLLGPDRTEEQEAQILFLTNFVERWDETQAAEDYKGS